MIKEMHLKDFRVFKDFYMSGLGSINIITGRNNVGKTTVLEAIYLASGAFSSNDIIIKDKSKNDIVLGRRGGVGLFTSIIRNYDEKIKPVLRLNVNNMELNYVYLINKRRMLIDIGKPIRDDFKYYDSIEKRICNQQGGCISSFKLNPDIYRKIEIHKAFLQNTVFLDPYIIKETESLVMKFWADLKFKREDKKIVKFINSSFDLGVESISYVPLNGKNQLILEFSDHSVRLVDLGDGVKYAILLYSVFIAVNPKIVLIDDVESHLHIGGLSKIIEAILDYSKKNNAQFIMTTHSIEFIEELVRLAKHKGFKSNEVTVFHLLRKGDRVLSRRYNLDEAYRYIFTIGSDLRKP